MQFSYRLFYDFRFQSYRGYRKICRHCSWHKEFQWADYDGCVFTSTLIEFKTKGFLQALRADTENTPLQIKLNSLAELIAKVGSIASLILFGVLIISFFLRLGSDHLSLVITAVTLLIGVVVVVPDGVYRHITPHHIY